MTKDKRIKSRCPKKVFWLFGFGLCAIVVLIAFLAAGNCPQSAVDGNATDALGQIFSAGVFRREPEPIESRKFGDVENKMNAAGVFGAGGRGKAVNETVIVTTEDNLLYGNIFSSLHIELEFIVLAFHSS